MTMSIQKMVSVLILSSFSSMAHAQFTCLMRESVHDTGYLIGQTQQRFLIQDAVLGRNKKKSTEEKIKSVEANIVSMWKNSEISGFKPTSKQLAETLVEVSEKIGVDHQILTAIVRKESGHCMFRFNKTGGDSGCTQMTSPALTEMRHQLGLEGSDKHSARIPEVLTALLKRYFEKKNAKGAEEFMTWLAPVSMNARLANYINGLSESATKNELKSILADASQFRNKLGQWIKKEQKTKNAAIKQVAKNLENILNDPNDFNRIRMTLRDGSQLDYDLILGALLLKIKFAVANGNFSLAVRNYNGSSKKLAYEKSVMGSAAKVSYVFSAQEEQQCLENHEFEAEIRKFACDLTEDPVECYNSFLRSLPNST